MACGSAMVSCTAPSDLMQGRMQYLSAGLLIGAIITEIYPILKDRLFLKVNGQESREVDWQNLFAALAGFCIGLVLMYSIKALDLDGDDDEEDLKEYGSSLAVPSNIPNLSEP